MAQGLRIALALNSPRMGGSERQALLLAGGLRGLGHRPVLVGFAGEGPFWDLARSEGIETRVTRLRFPLSPWYFPRNLWRALRLLRRIRPDVVIGYTSVPNLYGAWLAKAAGAKGFLWSERNIGVDRPPGWMERIARDRADLFLPNSEPGRDFLTGTLGVDPRKIRLIPNGVLLPERLAEPTDPPYAVCLANGRAQKDHATLLRAWAKVLADGPPRSVRLVLAGFFDPASPLTKEIQGLVQGLGLRDSVEFRGPVADPAPLLAQATLGVLSSSYEGTPNAVLEYMAAGLPVVASDIPGTRMALGQDGGRWLFPIGDDETLARHFRDALARPDLAREEGRRNRLRVEREFSTDTLTARTLAAIHEVLPPPEPGA